MQGASAAALVETAGGVASPGPSGSLQVGSLTARGQCRARNSMVITSSTGWFFEACFANMANGRPAARGGSRKAGARHISGAGAWAQCDILRPGRLPGVLVGDGRLGGISATIAALEVRRRPLPILYTTHCCFGTSFQAGASTCNRHAGKGSTARPEKRTYVHVHAGAALPRLRCAGSGAHGRQRRQLRCAAATLRVRAWLCTPNRCSFVRQPLCRCL